MNIDDANISSIAQLQAQNNYIAQYGSHLQKTQKIEAQFDAQRSKLGKLTMIQMKEKGNLLKDESDR
jgi:hypothetical protein